MPNKQEYAFVIALIFSVLLHAYFLFYISDNFMSRDSHTAPVISVQLVMANKSAQPEAVEQTQTVVQDSQPINEIAVHESQQVTSQEMIPVLSDVEKMRSSPRLASAPVQSETVIEEINSDDNVRQLLTLVYQEINRHKHYPYIARKQGREGLVKLNFILHPDGRVTDVAVVVSSRFTVLDRAAQKAVEDISPFLMAADYLSYQQSFDVNLDFRLSKI